MLLSLHNFQLKEASGGSLNPLKVQPAIRADKLKANTVFVMVVSPVWWVTDWGSRKCAWFSASRQSLFLLSGCRYSDSLKNTFIQNILEPSWNRFYVRKRQIQNRNCCLMFFLCRPTVPFVGAFERLVCALLKRFCRFSFALFEMNQTNVKKCLLCNAGAV